MSEFVGGRWVSVYVGEKELDNTAWSVDKECDSISIYLKPSPIILEYIDKVIEQARRTRPEVVEWLETVKLGYELTGRFDWNGERK